MNYLQKILNRKKYLLLASVVIAILFTMMFQGATSSINQKVNYELYRLNGQRAIDTSIVIIHIDKNDIFKLKWPVKTNLYALLINKLVDLGAKRIGIEIYLPPDSVNASNNNKHLLEEIAKSKIVVLGSQAFGIKVKNDSVFADSIALPLVKGGSPEIITGHINYVPYTSVKIPTEIFVNKRHEHSFSTTIAGDPGNVREFNGLMKLNLYASWNSFKKMSLLEFLDKIENEKLEPGIFKDKYILIGLSDPDNAPAFKSPFDEFLPGIGMHALALDNLLKGTAINKRHGQLFDSIGLLIIIFITFFKIKNKTTLIAALFVFLFFSFLLLNLFNVELNYAFFLVPFFLYSITDFLLFLMEKRLNYNYVMNESEILNRTLKKKEEDLAILQRDFNLTEHSASGQIPEKITALIKEIADLKKNQQDSKPYESNLVSGAVKNFHGLVYKSQIMENLVNIIRNSAPKEANVLIQSEKGSCTELIARIIHDLSQRKNNSFIAVNCGAYEESLLESELLGHIKGALKNAFIDKTGRFEEANSGTIFLEEIEVISEDLQVKILRIIQTGEFEKVGSSTTSKLDVRIIASSNVDMEELVRQKRFLKDLYNRLNEIKIVIPPLRERREDIPALAEYFTGKEDSDMNLSKGAVSMLSSHEWEGGAEELEEVIKKGVIFARSERRHIIQLNDLPKEFHSYEKADLETLILDSLRDKGFSYSSISATASELGNLSRNVISENFRGILLKTLVLNEFKEDSTVKQIAGLENKANFEKVRTKLNKNLRNIFNDLRKYQGKEFDEVKLKFNSRYKNLPEKYHIYLDKLIQHELEN